jgi:hypothetical protein
VVHQEPGPSHLLFFCPTLSGRRTDTLPNAVSLQEHFFKPADEIDAIYRSALASQQLTLRDGGVEDLVKVVMARLSHERRRVEEAQGPFATRAVFLCGGRPADDSAGSPSSFPQPTTRRSSILRSRRARRSRRR